MPLITVYVFPLIKIHFFTWKIWFRSTNRYFHYNNFHDYKEHHVMVTAITFQCDNSSPAQNITTSPKYMHGRSYIHHVDTCTHTHPPTHNYMHGATLALMGSQNVWWFVLLNSNHTVTDIEKEKALQMLN